MSRIISLLLVLFLFAGLGINFNAGINSLAAQAQAGDVNGDGKVSATDALIALQAVSGKKGLDSRQKIAADVNYDGKITSVDAHRILQYVSGRVTLDMFVTDKFYTITNVESGKVLTVGNLERDKADVAQENLMASDLQGEQMWQLYEYLPGVFCIVAKNCGLSLTIGNPVHLSSTGVLSSQRWSIEPDGNGNFKIGHGSNYLTAGSSNISLAPENGSDSQLWTIKKVPTKEWVLVWSDEFDGHSIDYRNWSFEIGGGLRNNEQQVYIQSSANAKVSDGYLTIRTLKEQAKDPWTGKIYNYSSASLHTRGKKSFLHGRFEARMKMPYGPRIWPAFWTCGSRERWPETGEIDIMEYYGGGYSERQIRANVFRGRDDDLSRPRQMGSVRFTLPDGKYFKDDFHIIAAEWDENQIRFYCDGLHYCTYRITKSAGDQAAFTQPHYLRLNTAIQPDDDGSYAADNTYPQEYVIDYVRVYQQQ